MTDEVKTWDGFREAFLEQYYFVDDKERIKIEFNNARKGNRSIREWDTYLRRLVRHLPSHKSENNCLCAKFRSGLNLKIKLLLTTTLVVGITFKALVDAATRTEDTLAEIKAEMENEKEKK